MIVYHKKSSYFVPDEDANLIPIGSYVLKDGEIVYVDNLNELVPPAEEENGPTGNAPTLDGGDAWTEEEEE